MAVNQDSEEGTILWSETPEAGDADIDALIFGFDQKWGGPVGSGVTITYSIATNTSFWSGNYDGQGEPADRSYLNATQANAFRDALETWSDVANITFDEITDATSAAGDVGVIRVAFFGGISGGTAGYAYLPGFFESSGDVWLNPDVGWTAADVAPGGDGFGTMVHELGHALGLSHPEDFAENPDFDSSMTVMSYNPAPNSLFREVTNEGGGSFSFLYYNIIPETPMPMDIDAIQYLYGKNLSHNTGNNSYTFSTTRPFIKTIWDAGGTDTISVFNFTRACVIDLTAGHYSSIRIPSDAVPPGFTDPTPGIYNGTDNLAIAFGVTIENATGGNGNDKLIGNNVANVLKGGAGNDTLEGLGGADSLTGGTGNDIYVTNAATEINKATADAGTDLVKSSVTYVLGAQQENLTLTGAGAINGTGSTAANVLAGNGGANVLKGAGGNDTLFGAAGNDTLFGGAGSDTFQFRSVPTATNVDQIADFNPAADSIHLADSKFTGLDFAGGLDPVDAAEFASNATRQAGDATDRIVYNTSTGELFYDADGSGAAAAVQIAVLTGAPSITVNDLFVYDG